MAGQFGRTPGFFQLYTPTDRDLAASLVSRAEAAGFKGIVVTLDTWITGWRPTWPPAISRSCAGTAWPTTPPTRSAEADLIRAVDGYPSLADLTPDSLRRTCPHHA